MSYVGETINNQRYQSQIQTQVQHQLTVIRDQLESNLISDMQLVKGLIAVIALNPDLTQNQFEIAMRPIFKNRTQLRNVALAPDMVISRMYPLEGNRGALGLNYRNLPAQFEAADKARIIRKIILAGPLKLVQGGTGIIARVPVYLPDKNGVEYFWGLVSAVIDADKLFNASGLISSNLQIKIALRGKDAEGVNGDVFFGHEQVFNSAPVLSEIRLPYGSWQLAAVPLNGWPLQAENVWVVRGVFLIIFLIVIGAFMSVLFSLRRVSLAQQKAEAATRIKSEFLATMSHEIRTPMNGVMGAAVLLRGTDTNSEQQKYIDTISSSANILLTVINDILDFSKLEAGKVILENRPFDIRDLVNTVLTLVRPGIDERQVSLLKHIDENVPAYLTGDSTRLKQILLNLLSNAIKFTEHGEIKLILECIRGDNEQSQLRFIIEDTGIGIAEDKINKLFDQFAQADTSTTREYGGAGLGLSISKSLVELMQGRMWAESQQGKGSRFIFEVTLAEAPAPEAVSQNEHATSSSGAALNILLVEDNEVNQMIASHMLEELGHTVDVANDGYEAIEKIEGSDYGLVLMDIMMPGIDGVETTRLIRKNPAIRKNLPIVALTANAIKGDAENYLEAGMNGYLSKPIAVEKMIEELDKWSS